MILLLSRLLNGTTDFREKLLCIELSAERSGSSYVGREVSNVFEASLLSFVCWDQREVGSPLVNRSHLVLQSHIHQLTTLLYCLF